MESRSSGASSFGPSSRRSSSCGASRGVVVVGGAPALLLLLLSEGSGARLGLGGGACRGLGSDCRGLGSTFAGVLGVLLLLPMWCYGVLCVDATFSKEEFRPHENQIGAPFRAPSGVNNWHHFTLPILGGPRDVSTS